MEDHAVRIAALEQAMTGMNDWAARTRDDVLEQVGNAASRFIDNMEKKSQEASARIDQISQGCNAMLKEITTKHSEVVAWQRETQTKLAEFESRTNKNQAAIIQSMNQKHTEDQEKVADAIKNMQEAVQMIRTQMLRAEANVSTVNQQWANLVSRVDGIQQRQAQNPTGGNANGQGHHPRRGYLPEKATIPKTLADKYEEWRQWKEDVEDFLDTRTKGMKVFLQQVANDKDQGEVTQMYKETQRIQIEDVGGDFDQVTQDEVQVWRALKGLTDGEARKVVLSVRDEDGFLAWRKLCLHFEPTLAAMQG